MSMLCRTGHQLVYTVSTCSGDIEKMGGTAEGKINQVYFILHKTNALVAL